jgi:hypothetical protein
MLSLNLSAQSTSCVSISNYLSALLVNICRVGRPVYDYATSAQVEKIGWRLIGFIQILKGLMRVLFLVVPAILWRRDARGGRLCGTPRWRRRPVLRLESAWTAVLRNLLLRAVQGLPESPGFPSFTRAHTRRGPQRHREVSSTASNRNWGYSEALTHILAYHSHSYHK